MSPAEDQPPDKPSPVHRLVLLLIAAIAIATFVFAVLQLAG
jgi:hypothetical protein